MSPTPPPPLPIDTLVERFRALAAAPLPPDVAALTRTYLVDSIGVGLAGTITPENRSLLATAVPWEGPSTTSTLWGRTATAGPLTSAMVNAHAIHGLEFDCVHEGAVLHPFTVVLPVLAAHTQRAAATGRRVAGDDFLRALAIGVEIACRLGEASTTGLRFFRPATAGHLAATVALGLLDTRDHDQLVAALGIAFGQASGSMQSHREGSPLLAVQMAFAARNALCSHDLAGAGFTGPRAMLEPPLGYYGLIEEAGDVDRLLADIGGDKARWELRRASHKPFPSGRATHATLSTLRDLRLRYGLSIDGVASVELTVPPLIHHLVGRGSTTTMTAPYARLCVPFLSGLLMRDGDLAVDALTPANLADASLLAFSAERVTVRVGDPAMDPNAFVPQRIVLTTTTWQRYEVTVTDTLGSPAHPLTPEQHLGKATSNADACARHGGVAVDMAKVAEIVERIEQLVDTNELWEKLGSTTTAGASA